MSIIELHGYPLSNYYNKVKLALIWKEVEFEEVKAAPGDRPELSPMGKIPYLKHGDQWVFESQVIIEYLEENVGGKNLYPTEAKLKVFCREIIAITDLYIDTALRSISFGENNSRLSKDDAEAAVNKLGKAVRALQLHWANHPGPTKLTPFLFGSEPTYADAAALATWSLIDPALSSLEKDFAVETSGVRGAFSIFTGYLKEVTSDKVVAKVLRTQKAARRAMQMAAKRG